MTKRTGIGLDKIRQRGFSGEGLPAGMAKDKLIFIIICSAAIGVAVVTAVFTLFPGRPGDRIRPSQWQCLDPDCGHEFSKKTKEYSPVECEKCAGPTASVNRLKCPECGENVLVSRTRLTERGEALYRDRKESSGQTPALPMGPGMSLPMESQFWVQQADGSYGWTDWFFAGGSQSREILSSQKCSKCSAPLYERR